MFLLLLLGSFINATPPPVTTQRKAPQVNSRYSFSYLAEVQSEGNFVRIFTCVNLCANRMIPAKVATERAHMVLNMQRLKSRFVYNSRSLIVWLIDIAT